MPTIAICNGTARTSKYIIEIALEKGYHVKALVRSSKRFYEQSPKHPNLTAHEWSNFEDVATLSTLLVDVSTFFIALSPSANQPTSLNQDCVQSACAALRRNLPSGSTKSPTKIVLLSSAGVNPELPSHSYIETVFTEHLLGNQMADLSRSQAYLRKQDAWLSWIITNPGALVDSEEAPAKRKEYRIELGTQPTDPITYRRLAAAMFAAGEEEGEKWDHKFITPIPSTKVKTSIGDFQSARAVIAYYFRTKVFPSMFRGAVFGILCAGLGYYARMKEQGAWVAATLGLDLR